MTSTEMIKGMGEVIDYIKKIEKENKELKEENEELKVKADSDNTIQMIEKLNKEFADMTDKKGKEINKLKEKIVEKDLTSNCFLAELSFTKSSIEDFSEFNDWLKENFEDEDYKKMYEWFDMADPRNEFC